MKRIVSAVFYLYYDGFRSMTTGNKLWLIIAVKLAIMFLVLKLFFFPDILRTNYHSDKERGDHVINELTNKR